MTTTNQDQITAFLAGHGLTAAQIAGVEGNLQIESGMNPAAVNKGEGAVGIAQWEGGRRTALDAYAKATGGAETNLNTQLGFMWQELTGSESGSLTALMGTSDPASAATVFDQQYERSAASSLPLRVGAAQAIASGGVQGGSGQVQGATANPAGFLGNITGSIWSGLLDALAPLGRLVVDAGLVLMGVTMLIVGAVIIAKGGDNSGPAPQPAPAPSDDEGQAEEHEHRDVAGGASGPAEGAAEDAAVLA